MPLVSRSERLKYQQISGTTPANAINVWKTLIDADLGATWLKGSKLITIALGRENTEGTPKTAEIRFTRINNYLTADFGPCIPSLMASGGHYLICLAIDLVNGVMTPTFGSVGTMLNLEDYCSVPLCINDHFILQARLTDALETAETWNWFYIFDKYY